MFLKESYTTITYQNMKPSVIFIMGKKSIDFLPINKINRDKIINRSINLLVINLYSRDFEIPKCF